MMRSRFFVMVSAVVVMAELGSAWLRAEKVDFEKAYTVDKDIDKQPVEGAAWTRVFGDGAYLVKADSADKKNHVIEGQPGGEVGDGVYWYSPEPRNLGKFSRRDSKLRFSVRVRLDEAADDESAFIEISNFGVGLSNGAKAVEFKVFQNGRLRYFHGDAFGDVLDKDGKTLILAPEDGFVAINCDLDYKTKTYTLKVNNIAQTDAAKNAMLAFMKNTAEKPTIFLLNKTTKDAGYRKHTLDDFELKVIVSPATAPAAAPAAK